MPHLKGHQPADMLSALKWLEEAFQELSFPQQSLLLRTWIGLQADDYQAWGLDKEDQKKIKALHQHWQRVTKRFDFSAFGTELSGTRSRFEKALLAQMRSMAERESLIWAKRLLSIMSMASSPYTVPDPQRVNDLKRMLEGRKVRFSAAVELSSPKVNRALVFETEANQNVSTFFQQFRVGCKKFLTALWSSLNKGATREMQEVSLLSFTLSKAEENQNKGPDKVEVSQLVWHHWLPQEGCRQLRNSRHLVNTPRQQPYRKCKKKP